MNIPKISPFKLLKPYGQGDLALFFGREEETRRLTEALLQTKFILLYGASGTGKTSLIQCGLQGMFSPRDWMPIFVRRGNAGFPEAIREALKEQYEAYYAMVYPGSVPPPMEDLSLREWVQALFNLAYVPVYLILDQFEEMFILGTEAEQEAFFETLQDLRLFEEDLFCKLLIVTREEYIAHFYHFEAQLPFLFEYRFRVEKMREGQLERVVRKTLQAEYPGYPGFNMDDKVPAQIVQNLGDERKEVDLTTLQVYLDRLYRDDLGLMEGDANGREDICFDLALVGDSKIENVLAEFLEQQRNHIHQTLQPQHKAELERTKTLLPPRDIPLEVLFALVTDDGTKRSRSVQETLETISLKQGMEPSRQLVEACLEHFASADSRVLQRLPPTKTGEVKYEISHDRLAEQVFKRFDDAEAGKRLALATLENKRAMHNKSGQSKEYLSLGELKLVEASVDLDKLPEKTAEDPSHKQQLKAFYEDSRVFRKRQKQRLWWALTGVSALAVFAIMVAIYAYSQQQKERIGKLYYEGMVEAKYDPTAGLGKVLTALAVYPEDTTFRKGAYEVFSSNLFYDTIFQEKNGSVGTIAFSPDGKVFATAVGGTIRIYHLGDTLPFNIKKTGRHINCLLFKGVDTLYAGSINQTVYIFAPLGSQPDSLVHDSPHKPVNSMSCSQNGQWLCAVHDKQYATLWDISRRKQQREIYAPQENITASAISPDGTLLLSGTSDGTLTVYATSDTAFEVLLQTKETIKAISFSPNGNTAVVGDYDGNVFIIENINHIRTSLVSQESRAMSKIKDNVTEIVVDSIPAHSKSIQSINFSPDGRFFITASMDQTAKIFDVATRQQEYQLLGHKTPVWYAAWVGDGEHILSADANGNVYRWAFCSPFPMLARTIDDRKWDENKVLFTPDGKYMLFCARDTVHIFDGYRHNFVKKIATPYNSDIKTIAISSHVIAIADDHGDIYLWDILSKNEPIDSMKTDMENPTKMSFSKDGKYLLIAPQDSTYALLWEIEKKSNRISKIGLEAHASTTTSSSDRNISLIALDPAGQSALLARNDNTITLYSVSGKVLETLTLQDDQTSLYFFQNNRDFIVLGASKMYRYDHNYYDTPYTTPGLKALAWPENGDFYASFDPIYENRICTYTADGCLFHQYRYNDRKEITSIAVHPHGAFLAAATNLGELLIWKVRPRLRLATEE